MYISNILLLPSEQYTEAPVRNAKKPIFKALVNMEIILLFRWDTKCEIGSNLTEIKQKIYSL